MDKNIEILQDVKRQLVQLGAKREFVQHLDFLLWILTHAKEKSLGIEKRMEFEQGILSESRYYDDKFMKVWKK